jgi:hypothetical protein
MEGKNRWKDGKEKKITILEITVWNSHHSVDSTKEI